MYKIVNCWNKKKPLQFTGKLSSQEVCTPKHRNLSYLIYLENIFPQDWCVILCSIYFLSNYHSKIICMLNVESFKNECQDFIFFIDMLSHLAGNTLLAFLEIINF